MRNQINSYFDLKMQVNAYIYAEMLTYAKCAKSIGYWLQIILALIGLVGIIEGAFNYNPFILIGGATAALALIAAGAVSSAPFFIKAEKLVCDLIMGSKIDQLIRTQKTNALYEICCHRELIPAMRNSHADWHSTADTAQEILANNYM